jgi:hypothetical protein
VERHGRWHVDEEAVAPAADEERDVLVSELRAGAVGVPVPDPDRATDVVEARELLAPAIEVVLGIEEEVVHYRHGPARGILREGLDLEPGPGAQGDGPRLMSSDTWWVRRRPPGSGR